MNMLEIELLRLWNDRQQLAAQARLPSETQARTVPPEGAKPESARQQRPVGQRDDARWLRTGT